MGIGSRANVGDKRWQRIGKIFVIADAEAVALHDDVTAKAEWLIVKRDDRGAFFGAEDWIGDCVAVRKQRFARGLPVYGIDSVLDRGAHDGLFVHRRVTLDSRTQGTVESIRVLLPNC